MRVLACPRTNFGDIRRRKPDHCDILTNADASERLRMDGEFPEWRSR